MWRPSRTGRDCAPWLLCLCLIGAAPAHAAELLTGALAQWLEGRAAPQLVETLGRHPRFQGESVLLVPMQGGQPSAASDELTERIREHLTYELLTQSQARILWRAPANDCPLRQRPPLLLGVELDRRGSRGSLRMAVIDTEENIWVPGVNLRWQGTLSRAQQRAATAPRQVVHSNAPLPLQDAPAIARRVVDALDCRLPAGLEGALYLAVDDDPELPRIREAARRLLARRSAFSFADSAADADWVLTLQLPQAGTEAAMPTLRAVLRDSDRDQEQWLAQVPLAVSDTLSSETARTAGPDAPAGDQSLSASIDLPASNEPLTLLPLALEAIEPCKPQAKVRCALIESGTNLASHLFVFQTRDGQIEGRFCENPVSQRDAGPKRYRVRLAEDEQVALHLVATASQPFARKLQRHLKRAPGQCDARGRSYRSWLQGLTRLLADRPADYQWQSLRLSAAQLPQLASSDNKETP
ncbi:MAG: hypothetical protein AAGI15_13935 [Pseudomonadota bacterium]